MKELKPLGAYLTAQDLGFLRAIKITPPVESMAIPDRLIKDLGGVPLAEGLEIVNHGVAECPNCGHITKGLYLDAALADSYESPNCGIACRACHLKRKGYIRFKA